MTAVKLYVRPVSEVPGTPANSPYSVSALMNFEPRDTIMINDDGVTITSANIVSAIQTYLNGNTTAKYVAYLYTNNFIDQVAGNAIKSLTDPQAYWLSIDKDVSTTVVGTPPKTNSASVKGTHYVLAVYPKDASSHLAFSQAID